MAYLRVAFILWLAVSMIWSLTARIFAPNYMPPFVIMLGSLIVIFGCILLAKLMLKG